MSFLKWRKTSQVYFDRRNFDNENKDIVTVIFPFSLIFAFDVFEKENPVKSRAQFSRKIV